MGRIVIRLIRVAASLAAVVTIAGCATLGPASILVLFSVAETDVAPTAPVITVPAN